MLVGALVPYGVVTVTYGVVVPPAGSAGAVATIEVADDTVNWAARPPKETSVAPENLLPVKVTVAPPAGEPLAGARALRTGPATYV